MINRMRFYQAVCSFARSVPRSPGPFQGPHLCDAPSRPGKRGYDERQRRGKPIGKTGPHGFLCWERDPGDTIVIGTAEGTSQAPLTVQSGNVYCIFQHVWMGLLIARKGLEVVDEDKGPKVLKKCHRPKIE
ncbi:hypothetical protein SBV1_2670013 [Verrucomicrobia bacterium]|nr:hypothetical protein SBV1_2670013 [Verrucomicrobiota bacterium]